MKDLALIVADKNMDFALRGILSRIASLKIRSIEYETRVQVGRDGGVRTYGPDTLSLLHHRFYHGIIMFDWNGSGTEFENPSELEQDLDQRLEKTWGDRAKAIVIEPELDAWVWGSDNALREVLDWNEVPQIREWLETKGFVFHTHRKPIRPKNALNELMFKLKRPRSSALYEQVANKISLEKCVDPAFLRLKNTLQEWFPASRHDSPRRPS